MKEEKINDDDEFIKVGSESIKDFPKKCDGLKLKCMVGLNRDFRADYYAFKIKPDDEYVLIVTRMVVYKKVKSNKEKD